jgi:DNA-binding NarL/FixJ family response regulator
MGKVKILIIEDELTIVKELKEILKILDYEIVKTITSKEKFIENIISFPIDIIIMRLK